MSATTPAPVSAVPAEALLAHWQGHRRLTRRLIEAYPEDQLFTFSVGGMRSFGVMVLELISIAAPMVRGVVTDQWKTLESHEKSEPRPKAEILQMWDESTAAMNELWPQISQERFAEKMTAFGMYPGVAYDLLLYAIDNEIHHRGQGYVFLRALGIAPPPFYER
jgi:uncharacterized damage-inducible protein DinB